MKIFNHPLLKIFIFIVFIVNMASIKVSADNSEDISFEEKYDCINSDYLSDNEEDEYEKGHLSGAYYLFQGKIYNADCLVKDVDIPTFKVIDIEGDKYGKDKNYIYNGITPLKGIEVNNFKTKKFEYKETPDGTKIYYVLIYDDNSAWLEGLDFSIVNVDSLEYLDTDFSNNIIYFKDKNNVFLIKEKDGEFRAEDIYYYEILKNTNPKYFSFGYKTTDDAIYWYGKKISQADPDSFELMNSGFAKDKNNVYYEGAVDYEIDTKSFNRTAPDGIDIYIYVDKNNSYYGILKKVNEIIKEIPESKESLNQSIKSSILDYRKKYPGYIPNPIINKNNKRLSLLKRILDFIDDYKYTNIFIYYSIFSIPVILLIIISGTSGFIFWKRKKK